MVLKMQSFHLITISEKEKGKKKGFTGGKFFLSLFYVAKGKLVSFEGI